MIDWRRGWGQSAMGICAFCYMCSLFGVVMLHRSMVNWRRGTSVFSICAFLYMCNLFSEVIFQRSMLDWRRGVHLHWVWPHFSIGFTGLV